MQAAQAAAKDFVKELPRDMRAGIVTFAGNAVLVQPPTQNRDDLVAAIDRFQMQRHTAIGSGIIVSLATLFPEEGIEIEQAMFRTASRRDGAAQGVARQGAQGREEGVQAGAAGSFQSAAIILLTDGRRTIGPDPLDAANMAADHGVRVFTVGFGSAAGGSVDIDGMSIYMRFDEETLKAVAGDHARRVFPREHARPISRRSTRGSTRASRSSARTPRSPRCSPRSRRRSPSPRRRCRCSGSTGWCSRAGAAARGAGPASAVAASRIITNLAMPCGNARISAATR